MIRLVDKGEYTRKHTNTVESVPFGRELGIGEGGVVSKHAEARGHGEDKSFEVGEVVIAGTADVSGREERKDVFGRFRQLPELPGRVSSLRMFVGRASGLRLSSTHRRRESAWAPRGERCLA